MRRWIGCDWLRYRGGVDTQLNALDADRDLFQAQPDLARLRLEEILTAVQLYKALGGGWQKGGCGPMSKETFETLLARNLKSLQRMVQSKLTGKEPADDIIQQALLRAFSRRDQLRSESNFKSW